MWHCFIYCSLVSTAKPRLHYTTVRKQPFKSCILLVQKFSGNCFSCFFVCNCQHLRHPTNTELGNRQALQYIAIQQPLPIDRVVHNPSFVVWQVSMWIIKLVGILRHYCTARATTTQSVQTSSLFGSSTANIHEYKSPSHLQQWRT